MNKVFKENYPEVTNQNRILPHNQFIYLLRNGICWFSHFSFGANRATIQSN
ncbi:MAG: hypothetical protein R2777_03645 [Chitinophagales bacterium]